MASRRRGPIDTIRATRSQQKHIRRMAEDAAESVINSIGLARDGAKRIVRARPIVMRQLRSAMTEIFVHAADSTKSSQ